MGELQELIREQQKLLKIMDVDRLNAINKKIYSIREQIRKEKEALLTRKKEEKAIKKCEKQLRGVKDYDNGSITRSY